MYMTLYVVLPNTIRITLHISLIFFVSQFSVEISDVLNIHHHLRVLAKEELLYFAQQQRLSSVISNSYTASLTFLDLTVSKDFVLTPQWGSNKNQ